MDNPLGGGRPPTAAVSRCTLVSWRQVLLPPAEDHQFADLVAVRDNRTAGFADAHFRSILILDWCGASCTSGRTGSLTPIRRSPCWYRLAERQGRRHRRPSEPPTPAWLRYLW